MLYLIYNLLLFSCQGFGRGLQHEAVGADGVTLYLFYRMLDSSFPTSSGNASNVPGSATMLRDAACVSGVFHLPTPPHELDRRSYPSALHSADPGRSIVVAVRFARPEPVAAAPPVRAGLSNAALAAVSA